jgi:hypothetical protein
MLKREMPHNTILGLVSSLFFYFIYSSVLFVFITPLIFLKKTFLTVGYELQMGRVNLEHFMLGIEKYE